MELPIVDIGIVCYRAESFIDAFTRDLEATSRLKHNLRIIDNTGNPKTLTSLWNQLWMNGTSEYVVILGTDVQFSKGWDEKLRQCLIDRPDVGVAVANPDFGCKRFPTSKEIEEISGKLEQTPSYKDSRIGLPLYAFMMRRKTLELLHGFDERFRFYFADREIQQRAFKFLNLKSTQVNHCPIAHKGRESTKEAQKRGEFSQEEEWKHRDNILEKMGKGILKPWHTLSELEKQEIRRDPIYASMRPVGGKGSVNS